MPSPKYECADREPDEQFDELAWHEREIDDGILRDRQERDWEATMRELDADPRWER